jgi:hypothetical protein
LLSSIASKFLATVGLSCWGGGAGRHGPQAANRQIAKHV